MILGGGGIVILLLLLPGESWWGQEDHMQQFISDASRWNFSKKHSNVSKRGVVGLNEFQVKMISN